ncbi:MAG: hypothetical protein IPL23_22860 [Saprospiraceae bacterium]|nr:hypothetical protein [Saprospiraceae bacterium]
MKGGYILQLRKVKLFDQKIPDHTTALFEKQGIVNDGYAGSNAIQKTNLIYILKYPNLQAKTDMWKAFWPIQIGVLSRAASEANGKLIDKIESQH